MNSILKFLTILWFIGFAVVVFFINGRASAQASLFLAGHVGLAFIAIYHFSRRPLLKEVTKKYQELNSIIDKYNLLQSASVTLLSENRSTEDELKKLTHDNRNLLKLNNELTVSGNNLKNSKLNEIKIQEQLVVEKLQSQIKIKEVSLKNAVSENQRLIGLYNDFDAKETKALNKRIRAIETQERLLVEKEQILNERDVAFKEGLGVGRAWLANAIADLDKARHESIIAELQNKKNPSLKGAEVSKLAFEEARQWKEKAKFLEHQLQNYKELFPQLEEYEELILNAEIELTDESGAISESRVDRARLYLSEEEYRSLNDVERNQRALDAYLKRYLSNSEIGRLYERQIGYEFETQGYEVTFNGAIEGFGDLGRDLIVSKGKEILIVQAKCWSKQKLIREKHIFQLFASALHFKRTSSVKGKVKPVFYSTAEYSDVAKEVASVLSVELKNVDLNKLFPMIKCNIGSNGEKIFHLPFDQQYDKIKIELNKGEFYANTVEEAVERGFRRALRFFGQRAG